VIRVTALTLAAAAVVLCLGACGSTDASSVAGGDAARGRTMIVEYGCGTCHVIPGVRTARGDVGPSLSGFGSRRLIAGEIPNTDENLIRWIVDPPAVEPKTGMPDMNVPRVAARDIAAFLRTR
jgi:cytochrome c